MPIPGDEKRSIESREATAGVVVGRRVSTPVAPSGLSLLGAHPHLGFASQASTCRPYRD